jgi:DNA mismatch endonuclease (patch repair protein)
MDTLTPEQRRFCMQRIKGRNTSPEVSLRSALWRLGLRFRIGHRLVGTPDIVFPAARLAVFVDGCFWHGCKRHSHVPKSNVEYWARKFHRNKKRDARVNRKLKRQGWRVLRVWEHDVTSELEILSRSIKKALKSYKGISRLRIVR